jgi:hypothetical protein
MNDNQSHKLGNGIRITPTELGYAILTPKTGVYLDDDEMIELVGWWCERHNSPLNGDMLDMIMDRVRCKELHPKTAAVCVRAIMAREVAQAVGGWVMDDEIPALGDDEGCLR